MAQTWDVKEVTRITGPMIIRPVGMGASSGIGVSVVETMGQMKEAVSQLHGFESVVASTYIKNPLLTPEGKKFHLRMYFYVCIGKNGYFKSELWKEGKILTAAEPYKNEDYGNRKIHDTHAGSTPYNRYYPEPWLEVDNKDHGIYPDKTKINAKELNLHMNLILETVAKVMKNMVRFYQNPNMVTKYLDAISYPVAMEL